MWRLFTAPLMHEPRVGAIFFALLGFYFLTPSLEQKWGGPKLIRFLILSSTVAYLFQMLMGKILPASVAAKLIPEYWFSSVPAIEAIAIAWAMSFKGQTVQLFFVLPVTSRGLVLFVVAMSVLMVITLEMPAAGLVSPSAACSRAGSSVARPAPRVASGSSSSCAHSSAKPHATATRARSVCSARVSR
ncbi:MAG: hypothetical protein H6717_09450 [Polyangiaceae bacterium]|nr:hypothetical protein [Polyangiaceae bacterium]